MRRRMLAFVVLMVLPTPNFAQQVVETGQTMAVTVETSGPTAATTVTYPDTMMPEAADFATAPTTTVTRKATHHHSKLAFWHWFRS